MKLRGKSGDVIFSSQSRHMANFSYNSSELMFQQRAQIVQFNIVGSRYVVQGCSNRSNKAAGLALHASPSDRTRDQWVRFVRIKRKNFFPQPQAKFVICSVHFEENCFTRAFDPTQRRQLKPGSLPSIWRKEEPSTERDSKRQRRIKEKERQKVRFLWVFLSYTFAFSCTRCLIF